MKAWTKSKWLGNIELYISVDLRHWGLVMEVDGYRSKHSKFAQKIYWALSLRLGPVVVSASR